MTATTAPQPPPDPPSGRRRLYRSLGERVLGGVAGGLGRHFDVDPVVFRIGFAGLALFGGLGVFLYLAAILFVPAEGDAASPLQRSRVLTVAGTAILAIAAIAAVDDAGLVWGPLVPLAVLGGIGYALYRAVRGRGASGTVTARRLAVWLVLGAGATLALSGLALGAGWAAAEGSGAVVAGLVMLLGAALLVAGVRPVRGARLLAVPALVIAVPLGVVAAADVSFDGGFGEREYRPATVAELPAGGYELGAGKLTVDLRATELPPGRETVLDLRLGMGAAEVLVAGDVCVEADTRFGAGWGTVRGRDAGGLDVDYAVRATVTGAPRLLVRADVGMGALRVAERPDRDWGGDAGPGADWEDEPVSDGGCATVETAAAR